MNFTFLKIFSFEDETILRGNNVTSPIFIDIMSWIEFRNVTITKIWDEEFGTLDVFFRFMEFSFLGFWFLIKTKNGLKVVGPKISCCWLLGPFGAFVIPTPYKAHITIYTPKLHAWVLCRRIPGIRLRSVLINIYPMAKPWLKYNKSCYI